MNYAEIATPPSWTSTHPYVATIVMDPVHWHQFERTFEDRPEVRILGVRRSQADEWTVMAACASEEIAERLESGW